MEAKYGARGSERPREGAESGSKACPIPLKRPKKAVLGGNLAPPY